MKRNVDIKEISDGRLYELNDMVKANCHDCEGCSSCCKGMDNTIVLDPYDIFRLSKGLIKSFEELLQGGVELNVVDGIILPNIKMSKENETCFYLNGEGRCSIHPYRPGICRLFPLGRIYEDGSFKYFLQIHECEKQNRSKIKVEKWIDTPNPKKYEKYITDWHYYIANLQKEIETSKEEGFAKKVSLDVLKGFYMKPYSNMESDEGFYKKFYGLL